MDSNTSPPRAPSTQTPAYSERLVSVTQRRGWRRVLDPQIPYRRNIRAMGLGRVLDVGCGTGRNLAHLDGNGVGVDHNETSVELARSLGLQAFTPHAFEEAGWPGAPFDTLLLAHVLEHLDPEGALELVRSYLPHIDPAGRVVIIVPQQRGFASDPTHVTYFDSPGLSELLQAVGCSVVSQRSFPFPGRVGSVFAHNETIVVGRRTVNVSA